MPNHAKQVSVSGWSTLRTTGRRLGARLLALIFTVCVGVTAAAAAPSPAAATDAGFSYREWTANEGSRSAGPRGTLAFKGLPITLDSAVRIKTPIGSFYHASSALAWEPQGWFRVDDIETAESAVSFAATDMRKGSYVGARRTGTPSHWCYVLEMDTWFDPLQLTR